MNAPRRIHPAVLALVGAAWLLVPGGGEASAAPQLVPRPRQVEALAGSARLGPRWAVATGVPGDSVAARILVDEAARCFGWHWRVAGPGPDQAVIEIREWSPPPDAPALLVRQGYRLEVRPMRIVIEGATAAGRLYGVQTLRQMLRGSPRGELSCVRIADWPALEWRGISDDISRGQVSTLEDFKAVIRQLAYYKVNLYQVYIEDMFLFDSAPTTGAGRGALSADDLREMVEEGRRLHVVVSPIFQTMAHQDRFLALEDNRRFADAGAGPGTPAHASGPWGRLAKRLRAASDRLFPAGRGDAIGAAAFSVRSAATRTFVGDLVDEIARVSGPPFFHVGGDEWQPPAADSSALDDYGRYVAHLAGRLKRLHGCRTMMYGDVLLDHPRAAGAIPRDVVVVDWQYDEERSFPSIGRLHDLGFHDVVVSPGLWSWRTFYPNYAKAFRNIRGLVDAGKAQDAIGAVGSAWGDAGAENLRENNWTGYAFVAASSWERTAPADSEFLRRFVVAEYGVDSETLARAERLVGWQEFDRTPWPGVLLHRPFAVRGRSPASLERMRALLADMRRVEAGLDSAAARVRFNSERLPLLRHAARRYAYVAERELFLDEAGRLLTGRTAAGLSTAERQRLLARLARLEALAARIRREFHSLWLANNRPQGLAFNDGRLEEQVAMIRTLRQMAIGGRLRVDDSFADMQSRSARSLRTSD